MELTNGDFLCDSNISHTKITVHISPKIYFTLYNQWTT